MLWKLLAASFLCYSIVGCGSTSKKPHEAMPVGNPGGGSKIPSFPPSPSPEETGLIDANQPAAVDLQSHIVFDRLVAIDYQSALRKDLSRIERLDLTSGTDNDAALMQLLQIQDLQPATLSTWLKDRVHYILSSNRSQYRIGLVVSKDNALGITRFPPDDPKLAQNIGASMMGTELYLLSKQVKEENPQVDYAMIEVNGKWVHANNQRNGVMRIGQAMFDAQFQVNQGDATAFANSVQRISTLFHEARHADGNTAAGSLGFSHILCPQRPEIPEDLWNLPACDANGNGPYMVGFRLLKAYIAKCDKSCSPIELTKLKTEMLDSLSRVVKQDDQLPQNLDASPEQGFQAIDISTFRLVPVVQSN